MSAHCAQLLHASLDAAVGAVTTVQSAEVASVDGAQDCRVRGTIAPAIRFDVRLPLRGWSGRYLQTGCGGLCGTLNIRVEHGEGCVPVRDHQVVLASSDMGHEGMGGDWAARNPATRADFGYRGMHLTALAAKALIRAFYGRPARYSYFSGCSDGGREALIEAQRFPEDFDGIAAGAPALNFSVQNSFYHAWNAISNTGPDGNALLTAASLPLLHQTVLAQCDERDGARDGVIDDPRQCQPDLASLVCRPGVAPEQCLSEAQIEAARHIYDGARDSRGRRLVMGGPMPGSELSWTGVFVPAKAGEPIASRMFVQGSVPNLFYEHPLPADWTIDRLAFDEATLRSFHLRGLFDATDPDLSAFRQRGGKLLLWHGWSDPHISPINSIGYYEAVAARLGRELTPTFARLFLLPGVYHCSGGEGPTSFDVLSPLMQWVEQHRAPEALQLHGAVGGRDGKFERDGKHRRKAWAWPDRAGHDASGRDARVAGHWQERPLDWLGADFFSSGYELRCDSGLPSECAAQAHAGPSR